MIHGTLPRATLLLRRSAGGGGPQALAANVDATLIVTAADRDLNLRRLERYMALVRGSGSAPHVILNKVDLAGSETALQAMNLELERASAGATLHLVSATSGQGVDLLSQATLGHGRTVVVLGSSGVGKSTLCNALLGVDLQDTGQARASDGRGRHTTTRRDLLLAPDGRGVLIDTPGLREVGLWETDALDGSFPELAELAQACRYRDCQHAGEPSCAVEAALERGDLDFDRFEGHEKLRRELARLEKRGDKSSADRSRGRARRKSQRRARSARRSEW